MKRFTAVAFLPVTVLILYFSSPTHQASSESASAKPARTDSELRDIASHPQSYQLYEQATDRIDSRQVIKIHSTAPLANNDKYIQLLPGSIRYFRSDGSISSDGENALINWTIGGESHSTIIGRPGAVIMVVRSLDGVVSWYALKPEMRC